MKKNLLLLTLLGGFLYVVLSSHKAGTAGVASLDCTGASGPGGCGGATCHGPSPSYEIGDTVLVLDPLGAPAWYYVPGVTYTLRVRGINYSTTAILPKFGYQLTVTKMGTPGSAGIFMPGIGSHVASVPPINVAEQYINALWGTGTGGFGTVYEVDVPWVAPPAGTGTVLLRAIVNAVDTNGTAGPEDHWPPPGPPIMLPEGPPPSVYGPAHLCAGSTSTLSGTPAGGTWESTDPSIATVSSTGTLTGVAPGSTLVLYTTGTMSSVMSVTVDPAPAAIAGIHAVCQGGTTTLSDATAGGTWISNDPSIAVINSSTGIATSAAASGTTTITYKTVSGGCYATIPFTVALSSSVTGTSTLCAGSTSSFTHPFAGGIWYSSNPLAATVSAAGAVTGVAAGTSVISYSLSSTGCDAARTITVNATTAPSVSGASSVCRGYTTTLSGSPAGGVWSSSDPSRATVNSSGVITGIGNGTAIIKYKVSGTCGDDSTTSALTVSSTGLCTESVSNPFAKQNELVLYPNPNKGTFSLNILANVEENAHIVVTNIVGVKVREFTIKTNEVNNIMLNQPPGVYFLSATTLGNKYAVKIVIE